MAKKNDKSAKKSSASAKERSAKWDETQPTFVKYNLNPRDAWAVARLADKEGISPEEAARRILNAGLNACRSVVGLPPWVVPGWKEKLAETRKKHEEKERKRPSLEAVGVEMEDTGKALVVTVGGEAYKRLLAGAEAKSRTFVDPSTTADVFREYCMQPDALTLGEDLADQILDDAGFDKERQDREELMEELAKNLRAVGLLKLEKKLSKSKGGEA